MVRIIQGVFFLLSMVQQPRNLNIELPAGGINEFFLITYLQIKATINSDNKEQYSLCIVILG